MEDGDTEKYHVRSMIQNFVFSTHKKDCTRVIFYVRRIGLYLYKYRIYGTKSIYILKGLAFVYQLISILHH